MGERRSADRLMAEYFEAQRKILDHDVRENIVDRLTSFTCMYEHVVRESLPELGMGRASDLAAQAQFTGTASLGLGMGASLSGTFAAVSALVPSVQGYSSPLLVSAAAFLTGIAAVYAIASRQSRSMQSEIWGAFQRRAQRDPGLRRLPEHTL